MCLHTEKRLEINNFLASLTQSTNFLVALGSLFYLFVFESAICCFELLERGNHVEFMQTL